MEKITKNVAETLSPDWNITGNSLLLSQWLSRNHLKLSEDSLLARDGNYANSSIANGQVVDFVIGKIV